MEIKGGRGRVRKRGREGVQGACTGVEQSPDALATMNSWERRCGSLLCLLVNADTKTGTLAIRVTEA
eukprot:2544175-Rhodomonas_salina.1